MNLEQLQQKLLAAARAHPPGDHVPYAFEKRIMSCLATVPAPDFSALWARALWRAAAPCVAVAILLGVWSLGGDGSSTAAGLANREDFSQHFERTMLAVADEQTEDIW